MELEYVAKAARRYWVVVAVFLALGLFATMLLPTRQPVYEATSQVLVAPATNQGQPGDRFVMGQVVVMQSPLVTSRAIDLAGLDMSIAEARQIVEFQQRPGTDVVDIVATDDNPQTAADLANGYVDAYFELLRQEAAADVVTAETEALDQRIAEMEEAIRVADEQIADVLMPFLEAADDAEGPRQIPALEQIAPTLATERQILGGQYAELLRRRADVEFTARPQIRSEIVQRAELPTEPVDLSSRLLLIALPLAGLFVGILAATVAGRSSKRVLDDIEVASVLGAPIAATIRRRTFRRPADHAIGVPPALVDPINQLCVQAERGAIPGAPMTVVVSGTQASAGVTTVATAMASRYAEMGSKVLLVDADHVQGDISRTFDVRADGLSALVDHEVRELEAGPTDSSSPTDSSNAASADESGGRPSGAFTPTEIPNLVVVGHDVGTPSGSRPRRDAVEIMEAARRHADVVIFDSGPMLDSVSSARLARYADVAVLVVPVRRQRRRPLEAIARQLDTRAGLLLPVATYGFKPWLGGRNDPDDDRDGRDEVRIDNRRSTHDPLVAEPVEEPSVRSR
jgi:Mrp family chromosome partitioning ATPase/capsular polysaccharide biosynthesis protein